jgi:hypothetical protein
LAERISGILNTLSHNKTNSFVESACWADDVKIYKLFAMEGWHFTDLPVTFPEVELNVTWTNDDALGIMVIISNTEISQQNSLLLER